MEVFVSPGFITMTASSNPGMTCPPPIVNSRGSQSRDESKTVPSPMILCSEPSHYHLCLPVSFLKSFPFLKVLPLDGKEAIITVAGIPRNGCFLSAKH
jgi:hypothetical protein